MNEKSPPAAWPAGLAGMVDYQAGSIVSRTLLDGKNGSITLFAFDAGQGLSEHTAPFDAFVEVLDGAAEVTVSGRGMTVKAGEAVVMPAGEPHSVRAPRRFKMLLVMVKS